MHMHGICKIIKQRYCLTKTSELTMIAASVTNVENVHDIIHMQVRIYALTD